MKHYAGFDAPDLPPIIASEPTPNGWRGVTAEGEVLDVRSRDGAPAMIPDENLWVIGRNGETLGYRKVARPGEPGRIDAYVDHSTASLGLLKANDPARALAEIEIALGHLPTLAARFNRAMALLALGRWVEGFDEYDSCESRPPFQRAMSKQAEAEGIRRWRGEDLRGRRILLLHDHGFGDTIMTLRHVPRLWQAGADVVFVVPREIARVAVQFAPVVTSYPTLPEADYYTSMLFLLRHFASRPEDVSPDPYLRVDPELAAKWRNTLDGKRAIGVAWSVGKYSAGDFPRPVPLDVLVAGLDRDAVLVSIQKQGADEARANGVRVFDFEDFADVAALIFVLDEVVSVDTAALHVAGAIGHPRVSGLLSYWHSWRWLAPLYSNVKLCRQDAPGDWPSAIAKLKGDVACR